ncbi:hypothetical protein J155_01345 [Xanthomonas citri pv. citri]|uniref:Uncharacterized protein n=2 Tax=Xanthomonas citri pv. citri TaxID=611301 RepID=A0AAI7ZE10_XANAC|nr:hypothetical protein XAC1209 [Xanthomonas citri pv. citri str. 306]AGI07113.1 Hypothetical Protein XCAW_01311 [Xanthomonas citri subsp. citri Aw12879]AJD67796.1 hypothetical protein J151_01347 [Xanthomonas citri subsp. citri A306]AJY81330.1 hypothetical protein J159_01344 [Xanthomonas citri pv. citri]AJY85752.1 hypothetical protein J158_01344 [Xanthomonas citri subsp. citri UI6]OOW62864.1 hypothetical protein Xths_13930 [Xanthomonas campestris pv. thespesiae]OOW78216.1 hypothetical protein
MNDPVNLRSGKQALIDTLRNSGLDGLFAWLLARLALSEASDLGPDNMLVIPGEDARYKVLSMMGPAFATTGKRPAATGHSH